MQFNPDRIELARDAFRHQMAGAMHTYQTFVVGYNSWFVCEIATSPLSCPAYFDDAQIELDELINNPDRLKRFLQAAYVYREKRERSLIAHNQTARALADWWERHQAVDREKRAALEAQQRDDELVASAKAKLTPEEFKALTRRA